MNAQLYNSFLVFFKSVGRFRLVAKEPNKQKVDAGFGNKSFANKALAQIDVAGCHASATCKKVTKF
ncbi:hypothetical protein BZ163_09390 [Pseudomonas sp. VI4.1]|nr:hypothetical protein BZ163_09390 [Pseudomonas sp. VI4.1]